MKKQHIGMLVGVVALIVLAVFFFLHPIASAPKTQKLSVVVSFYPLYFLSREIGGDLVDVHNVTPSGAEPHEYEPTPRDLVMIQNANVLVLNGAHLEPWSTNVVNTLDTNKTIVITAGDSLATGRINEEGQDIQDPHVWLSPPLAALMTDRITDAFVQADPSHETQYRMNASVLKSKLSTLNESFKTGLASCVSKNIVTSHAAFGYLANTYGLTQVPISGLSPDEEPSAKQLADVAEFAKVNNVHYIFFESLVSPKLSQTVASEIGAQTLVLSPLEGLTDEEMASGENYFTVMQSNLTNLKTALQCR